MCLYTHDAQYNPVMWPWEHLQVRKNLPIRAILLSRRFKVQHKPHWGALFLHHGGWRGGVGGHPASKVPQCVQAVGNTQVQWFPTNTREQVELLKLRDRKEVTKHGASGETGSSELCYTNEHNHDLFKRCLRFFNQRSFGIQGFNIWMVVIYNHHWIVLNYL